jgi:hypothetical protein
MYSEAWPGTENVDSPDSLVHSVDFYRMGSTVACIAGRKPVRMEAVMAVEVTDVSSFPFRRMRPVEVAMTILCHLVRHA